MKMGKRWEDRTKSGAKMGEVSKLVFVKYRKMGIL